jgi:molybdenum cofactor synthesis domain-containing protein
MVLRFGILTVSDRSSRGERPDSSGPALVEQISRNGWQAVKIAIVPDDFQVLVDTLVAWADSGEMDVVLTTGGTGFSPRDVTPEATSRVIERLAPGLTEVMRSESLKVTPHAMLSRAVAGLRGQTLIVNLPGSPKGALENLAVILPVLPHAVELLQDDENAEAGHRLVNKN